MNENEALQILDSSLFMDMGYKADEVRQQHINAAIEYELATAGLHRATMFEPSVDEDEAEALVIARARWIRTKANLRDATILYLLNLSEGLIDLNGGSLDEFVREHRNYRHDD